MNKLSCTKEKFLLADAHKIKIVVRCDAGINIVIFILSFYNVVKLIPTIAVIACLKLKTPGLINRKCVINNELYIDI